MQNIFHRYLNLPFEVIPPNIFGEFGDIVRHHYLDKSDYLEIERWFSSLGLYCNRVECFYTPPYGKVPIHTDFETYTNHAKINITWGPEEGVIQWWHSDIIEERVINGGIENTNEYHHNLWAKEEDCKLLHEANTNRASLVNVGILHGTNNPTDRGRWTLCFVPFQIESNTCVPWDMSIQIFKDYIEDL
jgi:hypothetical protein